MGWDVEQVHLGEENETDESIDVVNRSMDSLSEEEEMVAIEMRQATVRRKREHLPTS